MNRRPDLPPRGASRPALALDAVTARGQPGLPACRACGTVVYPVRETCPQCLSDDLAWRPLAGGGWVLAVTALRHSLEAYFRDRLPWPCGSVRLDEGPVALAHLGPGATPGARVRVWLRPDRGGGARFFAAGEAVPVDEAWEAHPMHDPNDVVRGRNVLVTGAGGGIGQALVAAFLAAGAGCVLAAARRPGAPAERVRPVQLDLADPASIDRLAGAAGEAVDILVNNAGVNGRAGLLDADNLEAAEAEMRVNYFGPLRLIRAVAPGLKARGQGVVVNILSVLAHASLPAMGSYCASKAAAASLTQGIRAELAPWGVRVVGVYPGAVDTAMTRGLETPKMSPAAVAEATVAAIRDGLEDVYPGSMAQELYAGWRQDPKLIERELAGLLPEPR